MRALAAASTYAQGGYEVLVDGIVGPWFFEPWLALAREQGLDLRYVVLRPDEAATVKRAVTRTAPIATTDVQVVRFMWKQFADLGALEPHAIDTTGQGPEATVAVLQGLLSEGQLRLG